MRTQNKPKPIAEAINNSNQRLSSGRTSSNSPLRVISPFNRRHARSTGKIPHTMSLFFSKSFSWQFTRHKKTKQSQFGFTQRFCRKHTYRVRPRSDVRCAWGHLKPHLPQNRKDCMTANGFVAVQPPLSVIVLPIHLRQYCLKTSRRRDLN